MKKQADNIRTINFGFSRGPVETYHHSFDFDDDEHGLSYLFEKFEIMLVCLGFEMTGKRIELVDDPSNSKFPRFEDHGNVTEFPGRD
jgi:hypothetical protein